MKHSLALRAQRAGGHTHVRVFMGPDPDHRAKCGDLTFTNEEWDALLTALERYWPGSPDGVHWPGSPNGVQLIVVTEP